jgi:hypothetical protein
MIFAVAAGVLDGEQALRLQGWLAERYRNVPGFQPVPALRVVSDGDRQAALQTLQRKYGPSVEQGDRRVSVPEDLAPDEMTLEVALELLASGERQNEPIGEHPETGQPIFVKVGRFGPFVGCSNYPECKYIKKEPRAARASKKTTARKRRTKKPAAGRSSSIVANSPRLPSRGPFLTGCTQLRPSLRSRQSSRRASSNRKASSSTPRAASPAQGADV